MPEPTQEDLTREFQAQLHQEFRAQARQAGTPTSLGAVVQRLGREGGALENIPAAMTPGFGPDRGLGEAVGSAALLAQGLGAGGFAAGASALPGLGTAFGAPVGGLLGEAAGVGAADVATRALTGQPQDPMGTVTSAMLPFGARSAVAGASGAGRTVLRFLPGFSAGRNDAMGQTLKGTASRLRGLGADVDDLYGQVERLNPRIPTPNLRQALTTLAGTEDEIAQGLKNAKIARAVKGLAALTEQADGALPFQAIRFNLRRIGQRIGAAAGKGEEEGAMKLLFKALQQDLEAAAEGSTVAAQARAALKTANAAARQRFAAEELSDLFTEAVKVRGDGVTTIDSGRLLTALDRQPGLVDVLPATEQQAITATLKALTKVPVPPPRAGVQFGTGATLGRGGAGAALATALGADPQTATIAAGAAASLPHLLSRLMVTEPGRQVVVRVLSTSPTLNHQTIARLTAAARLMAIPLPESVSLQGPRLPPLPPE